MRWTFLLLTYLLIAGVLSTNVSAQYRAPDDDFRIAVRVRPLNDALALMVSKVYALTYNNGGNVCASPRISFTVTDAGTFGNSSVDIVSGAVRSYLYAQVKAKAEVSNCIGFTVKIDISCSGTLPMSWVPPRWALRPKCELRIKDAPFMDYDISLDRPSPLQLPRTMDIQLPPSRTDGNLTFDVEFARYDGTRWVAETAPQNKLRVWPVHGHILWEPANALLLTPVGDPHDVRFYGDVLVGALTVGHDRRYNHTGVTRWARDDFYFGSWCFWRQPLCAGKAEIKSTLIAPPALPLPGEPNYGIVGGFFPLMIGATYAEPTIPLTVGIRLVVSGAAATISDAGGGKPKIELSVSINQLEAFDPITGATLTAKLALEPAIGILGPTIEADGDLTVSIDSIALTVVVDSGAHTVTVPLGDSLEDALAPLVPNLASIAANFHFAVPGCIAANEPKVIAEVPCSDFGNQTQGYISIRNPGGELYHDIDFSKTDIIAQAGKVLLTFWSR